MSRAGLVAVVAVGVVRGEAVLAEELAVAPALAAPLEEELPGG